MKIISNKYLTTLDVNSASDMLRLNEIKDTIRISNKSIFNDGKLRVVVKEQKTSKLNVYIYKR